MRIAIASVVLSLSAAALSQSLAGLPTCAQTAALNAATNSGCSSLTAECLCQNSGFVASLQNAIDSSCSGADQQSACAWGNSACSAYGVTIPCGGSSNAVAPTTTNSAASNPSTAMDNNAGGAAATIPSTSMAGSTSAGSAGTSAGTGAAGSMTSDSSSLPSTMVTSTIAMNGTASHTSVTNSTLFSNSSLKPTSTSTSSGVTSQYTGAASAAVDNRAGIMGAFAGVALIFALF